MLWNFNSRKSFPDPRGDPLEKLIEPDQISEASVPYELKIFFHKSPDLDFYRKLISMKWLYKRQETNEAEETALL